MLTANEGCGRRVLFIERMGVGYALAARYPDLLHTRTAFAMAKCKFEQSKGAWQKANFVSTFHAVGSMCYTSAVMPK